MHVMEFVLLLLLGALIASPQAIRRGIFSAFAN